MHNADSMRIEEMTVQDCHAVLARTQVARLACALHNQPYIVPVHIAFDGVSLYGYATLGQKIEWMRQNPLVCVQFDEVVSSTQWESVVTLGTYEELLPTGHEDTRRTAERLFERRAMWWEPASVPLAGQPQRPRILFRIHLRHVTGRRTVRDTPSRAHLLEPLSPPAGSRGLVHALRRLIGQR